MHRKFRTVDVMRNRRQLSTESDQPNVTDMLFNSQHFLNNTTPLRNVTDMLFNSQHFLNNTTPLSNVTDMLFNNQHLLYNATPLRNSNDLSNKTLNNGLNNVTSFRNSFNLSITGILDDQQLLNNATVRLRNGYDLPITGLDNGQFYSTHILAITCILLSLLAAIVVIIHSFRRMKNQGFFSWRKSERFIIYLALCDSMFNVSHLMDHVHVLVTRNHVFPQELCEFYGFMLIEFITAQFLMVNIISINGFVLIYYRKNINFGSCDWRLLCYMFGAPFVVGITAVACGMVGPNSAFCYIDGVNGDIAYVIFTIMPLLILLVNSALYLLTWYRIHIEEPRFKDISGQDASNVRASIRAARNMTLFVAAFFVQWWAATIYCTWYLIDKDDVPLLMFQFSMTFTNIGGILNAIVYYIIKHRAATTGRTEKTSESTALCQTTIH